MDVRFTAEESTKISPSEQPLGLAEYAARFQALYEHTTATMQLLSLTNT
jgi:hypothetical protein